MYGKHLKLAGLVVLGPLMASCAQQDNRLLGPPVPAPLTGREAAQLAQDAAGTDATVDCIDKLGDGHLFGVTSRLDPQGRPPKESRLLFVHNDGTVTQWPGR